jgi:transcriptional regulator with XRE-family HTH domain
MVEYIGNKIRTEKRITVRGLAKAAEVAPSTISKWENGSAVPDLAVLDLVAKAMKVNPFDLVKFV